MITTVRQRRLSNNATEPEIPKETLSCRRLWAAVLAQALWDLRRTKEAEAKKRYYLDNPTGWFESREVFIGSFEWICQICELDSGAVRARLQQMRRLPVGDDDTRDWNVELWSPGSMCEGAVGKRGPKVQNRE